MTHDELLAKLKKRIDPYSMPCYVSAHPAWLALRAIVERHKPWVNLEGKTVCAECCNYGVEIYPCITIKDIEEELK